MDKILSSIKQRVLQYIDNNNIVKETFFDVTGIAASNFKGVGLKSELGGDKIAKILTIFPEMNPEWLITGSGSMLRFINEQETEQQNGKVLASPQGIPLIPVEAMAGYTNGDVQVMDYDIQEDYIITPELSGKGIKYLIRASGSSMTPKYNNGDLLACRPITDISFMQWGKVYVLDTDQGPLVKRLYQCNPADDDCLECRSDNYERYPPFKIRKESIRRIAIVVAVLRLE